MKSFRVSLNGRLDDYVRLSREKGYIEAMDIFGIKGVDTALKLLREVAPDEVFVPSKVAMRHQPEPDGFDRAIKVLVEKCRYLQALNQKKDARIAELEKETEDYLINSSKSILCNETTEILKEVLEM